MNIEQLKQLMKEKLGSYSEGYFGWDDIPKELGGEEIEDGEWTQDGKYQQSSTVLKFGDKYFIIHNNRSGSYHTDWYYGTPEIYEVEPVVKVVTTTFWKEV